MDGPQVGDANQAQRVGNIVDADMLHSGAQQQEPEDFGLAGIGDRPWSNLTSDVLAEIFNRLSFEERLKTAPLVCKGWRTAASHPGSWRHVDMEAWFQKRVEADFWWEFECESVIERAVKSAVDRSCGQLEELRTFHCNDAAIHYIAERCPSLSVLSIPNSAFVTDKSMTNLASGCSNLKALDVSDCYNISNQALEAIGRNCKSLEWLNLNMVYKTLELNRNLVEHLSSIRGGDEEVLVVSKHMANLKHLEMMRSNISNQGLKSLVIGCRQLESLNLACSTSLSQWALDKVSENCPYIDFTKPVFPRLHVPSTHPLRVLLETDPSTGLHRPYYASEAQMRISAKVD